MLRNARPLALASFLLLVAAPGLASAQPVSVWVVGDSTAQPLEQGFASWHKADAATKVRTLFRNSSGLLRTDLVDWPKIIREELAHSAPEVAVISFGPNDAQGIMVPGKRAPVLMGTDEWRDAYGRRVRAFVDLFLSRGVAVYVLLQPFDADKKHAPLMRDVNAGLANAMVPNAPTLHLIDVPTWIAEGTKERGDSAPRLKNKDGIHLTFAGGRYLSQRLETRILEERVKPAESK